METIRKTESKIGTNDELSFIPKQMPRPQASSTRLNNENPSSFQEGAERNKKIRTGGNNNKDEDNSLKTLNDKNQE